MGQEIKRTYRLAGLAREIRVGLAKVWHFWVHHTKPVRNNKVVRRPCYNASLCTTFSRDISETALRWFCLAHKKRVHMGCFNSIPGLQPLNTTLPGLAPPVGSHGSICNMLFPSINGTHEGCSQWRIYFWVNMNKIKLNRRCEWEGQVYWQLFF